MCMFTLLFIITFQLQLQDSEAGSDWPDIIKQSTNVQMSNIVY